jgi:Lipase
LNHSGLCSHARAVDLFVESLDPSCSFKAFPCPGLRSFGRDFIHGNCFTCDGGVCGEMGPLAPQRVGRGQLYFVTRATKPYCGNTFKISCPTKTKLELFYVVILGQQIRASVRVSPLTRLTRGTMIMQVHHGATVTTFELSSSRLGSQ